ncbi:transcriptional regulator [Rhizobium rhizosphaerae]|uniref:Transcriptional regulator n=1 Tax=Xaviernesmea rhizosphaerae TaxID=1672749 RepID=A0A1Q9AMA9_9HYPH|nr:helix-turn-helix transcriptional regulator [Xaviernesmea rhizosphaerae]OLP56496.1 transcriptional regulator [Xaviernesmea rhizosphaerae]
MTSDPFLVNLRFACTTRRSVSDICRAIGLNRQQFNRYIAGQSRPSPHNLARIAAYFGVSVADFALEPRQFELRILSPDRDRSEARLLLDGFPGDLQVLRRHLGYYQTFHLSPSWPGMVVSSCTRLWEERGSVRIKSIERMRDPANEIIQFSKYVGLVTCWRNRLFVAERSVGRQPLLSQTILVPFEEHQRVYLRGTTMGVSWRKGNMPYASRMIWRALGQEVDKRQMLARCGVLAPNARSLPPTVRQFLSGPEADVLSVMDAPR